MKPLRVLLLLSEMWDDAKYGNNNMSNWFADWNDVELATLCCSPGTPNNRCCKSYFRITDREILNSLLKHVPAGSPIYFQDYPHTVKSMETNALEGIPHLRNEFFRGMRDLLWYIGRINQEALRQFILNFQPDVVFTQRKASFRILRMEREVHKLFPQIPFVAYTADDECSLRCAEWSPIFWLRRLLLRQYLQGNAKFYSSYFTVSEEQAREYQRQFSIPTALLEKCGDFLAAKPHDKLHTPLRVIYAGKLYCNRWKTLQLLAQTIHRLNTRHKAFAELHIYTQSPMKADYKRWLDNRQDSFIMGQVAPDVLPEIYKDADIALHVEAFDWKNRLATRFSFSTKVVDCMKTGCCVMVIAPPEHSALIYLKQHNAAMTVDDPQKLLQVLTQLEDDPTTILRSAERTIEFGKRHLQKQHIQKKLYEAFVHAMSEKQKTLRISR